MIHSVSVKLISSTSQPGIIMSSPMQRLSLANLPEMGGLVYQKLENGDLKVGTIMKALVLPGFQPHHFNHSGSNASKPLVFYYQNTKIHPQEFGDTLIELTVKWHNTDFDEIALIPSSSFDSYGFQPYLNNHGNLAFTNIKRFAIDGEWLVT